MKIKRYLDKDMRQVLRRVRDEQGPDAVILSNRRQEDGIEVIAAVDYDESLVRHALGFAPDSTSAVDSDALASLAENGVVETEGAEIETPDIVSASLESKPIAAEDLNRSAAGAQLSTDVTSMSEMREEIASMRGLLETQVSGLIWKDASRRSPMRAQILRNLARIGLAPDIANITVNRLEPVTEIRSIWHQPLMTLASMIPVSDDKMLSDGGVFCLIGPTGVGKTTTIAKIAARYAIENGPDDIALICADSYRIGAKEHLMAFANIVGVHVHAVSDNDELTALLDRLKNKKLILIDTEGRSQRDREISSRLAAYGSNKDRVRFYLTLSAACQEAALDETVRVFNKVPLEGCIITKIDEAAQIGCVLSALIRHDLPVAWLSDGQGIPDDLHAANLKKLWLVNRAVECMEASEPQLDERHMAENYTQLRVSHA